MLGIDTGEDKPDDSPYFSGHTHDHDWRPAREGQSIAQLIGGAPHPARATLIEGRATRNLLTVRMSRLGGDVIAEVEIKAG